MRQLAADKCKAHFLGILGEVEQKRESITIAKNGRPVAMVLPLPLDASDPLKHFYIGPGEQHGDIVSALLPPEEYEALR